MMQSKHLFQEENNEDDRLTERNKAEEALRDSEEKYRLFVERANEGIILIQDGKLSYMNPRAIEFMGYSEKELASQNFTKFIHPEDREAVISRYLSKMEGEDVPLDSSYRIINKNGTTKWVRSRSALLTWKGKPALLTFLTDITERKRMEDELRKSEARQALVLRSLPMAFYIAQPFGDYGGTWVSEQIDRISGFTAKQFSENIHLWASRLHPEDRDHALAEFESLLHRNAIRVEYRWQAADGRYLWFQDNAVLVRDENGDPKEIIGTWLDITESKQAEEEIRESEERYRILIEAADSSGQAIVITQNRNGMEAVSVFSNETAVRITGYLHEELSAVSWLDIVHPRDRDAAMQRARKRMQGEDLPGLNEISIIRKDGTEVSLEIFSIKSKFRGDTALVTFFRDITERKQEEKEREGLVSELQAALKEVKTLSAISETVNRSLDLEQVLNDALDRIMELFKPHSSHIRLLDDATQEMVLTAHKGLAAEDLKKMTKRLKLKEAISIHAVKSHSAIVIEDVLTDPRTAGRESFAEKMGCRTLVTIPLYAKDKMLGNMSIRDRKPSAFTTDEIQLFTSIGRQVGTAIENASLYQALEDAIKELKETQDKLQQVQKMESIGTLAGGIAHDFNNILTPIIVQSELALMDLDENSPIRYNLEEVMNAGLRAKDLVKQILTFSRQTDQQLVPLKITPIIREAIKLLRASLPSTIEIRLNLKEGNDRITVDPTQIHQVLMNLCTNAGLAMQERGGILEVDLIDVEFDSDDTIRQTDLDPGPYLKLTVSDTGHGIPPEAMDRIFDPFFTTKERTGGTGMGLAVVHGIISSYGGAITVESEQDKGTTFNVFLLRTKSKARKKIESIRQLPTGTERVLIVDDEIAMVNTLHRMLDRLGYKVTSRTSSLEALELFRNKPDHFELVITDMTMPNMTGDDLVKEFLQIRPDVPIILCTGFSEKIDKQTAEEIGINAFIMKPIVMREIGNTIREVLDKK